MRLITSLSLVTGAAVLALAASLPAAGPGAARSPRQCFHASTVSGFTEATRHSVIVTTGPRDYYKLDTFGPCDDLDFRETIAIKATSGSEWICSDMDAELIVPTTIGPRTCHLQNMRKLSAAEVEALRHPRKRR